MVKNDTQVLERIGVVCNLLDSEISPETQLELETWIKACKWFISEKAKE